MADDKQKNNDNKSDSPSTGGKLGLSGKLGGAKLSITAPGLKRAQDKVVSHGGSRSKVVVVTKNRGASKAGTRIEADDLTEQERNRRLQVVRQAEEQRKYHANKPQVSRSSGVESPSQELGLDADKSDMAAHSEGATSSKLGSPETEENVGQSFGGHSARGKVRNLDHLDKPYRSESAAATPSARNEETAGKAHDDRNKFKKKDTTTADREVAEREIAVNRRLNTTKRGQKRISANELNTLNMDGEDGDSPDIGIRRGRSLSAIKRARERARRQMDDNRAKEKIVREVMLPDFISVQDLANRMAEKATDVMKCLINMGMMVTINQLIDADTAEILVGEFGHTVKRISDADIERELVSELPDMPEDLEARPPVVTVMGHVDHGKTSLLDALRATDVAAKEAGGITQHIGAYQVTLQNDRHITFLDTPGHEAFTSMRSRGAKITDIVVLVVAADDGIMAQTIEAINHAKAANVPIVVAVNKMDKPNANPTRVKNELLMHNLIPEEMGGDTIVVEVSAKAQTGLDKLEEVILLQSDIMELKANPNRQASGTVIESEMDKGRGPVATLLVQAGTLRVGDIVVAGTAYGKVRALLDDKGRNIAEAIPAMPVVVLGLGQVPSAGDQFIVTPNEKIARDIVDLRTHRERQKRLLANSRMSLEQMFVKASEGGIKEVSVIVKADTQGSVEAIVNSLTKLKTEEVAVKVAHSGVGGVTESDVSLSTACGAIILAFNVRANNQARELGKSSGVDIRYYSIIYNLIDDIKAAMSGMLSPIIREEYLGTAEIRQVFNITKVGKVAGCFITDGMVRRNAHVRLIRDDVVIHDGKLKILKRFKEDVREAKSGFECGMSFDHYEDIKVGDRIECYELKEEVRTL